MQFKTVYTTHKTNYKYNVSQKVSLNFFEQLCQNRPISMIFGILYAQEIRQCMLYVHISTKLNHIH